MQASLASAPNVQNIDPTGVGQCDRSHHPVNPCPRTPLEASGKLAKSVSRNRFAADHLRARGAGRRSEEPSLLTGAGDGSALAPPAWRPRRRRGPRSAPPRHRRSGSRACGCPASRRGTPALPSCHWSGRPSEQRNRSLIHRFPSPRGDHLKRRRLELGFLQREVAKELGVSEWTLRHWEEDARTPAIRFVPRIIAFLGYGILPGADRPQPAAPLSRAGRRCRVRRLKAPPSGPGDRGHPAAARPVI